MGDYLSKCNKQNLCCCLNSVSTQAQSPQNGKNAKQNVVQASPQTFAESLQLHQKEQKELDYLSKMTNFSENTIRMLYLRFNTIDAQIAKDSAISIREFSHVVGVSETSLLAKRFFHHIDKNNYGSVTFRNFVSTMSILQPHASKKEKLDLSFFLYDLNNDGHIDKQELTEIISSVVQESKREIDYVKQNKNYQIMPDFTDQHIHELVEFTFEKVDKNKDGKIDLSEYAAYCDDNPRILEPFTLDIEKLMEYEARLRRERRYSTSIENRRELHHGPLTAATGGTGGGVANVKSTKQSKPRIPASPKSLKSVLSSKSRSKSLIQLSRRKKRKSKSFSRNTNTTSTANNSNRHNGPGSPKLADRLLNLNPFKHSKIKVSIADMELTQIEKVTTIHNAKDVCADIDFNEHNNLKHPNDYSSTGTSTTNTIEVPSMSVDSGDDTCVSVVSEVKNTIAFEIPFKEVAHHSLSNVNVLSVAKIAE